MSLVSPRERGRGKKEVLLGPISEGFSEEVNFNRERMELGRVLTTGQGQLMGCPTRRPLILGPCRAMEMAAESHSQGSQTPNNSAILFQSN